MDKKKEGRKLLTDKDIKHIGSLQSIYMNGKDRKIRHTKVLKKMEELQIRKVKEHDKQQRDKEKKHRESLERQRKQIQGIRDRYDDEQYERYLKHFVMWGGKDTVLVERTSRDELGLPEEGDPDGTVSRASSTRFKRREEKQPVVRVDGEHLRERNASKFDMMLNPSYGSHVTERVLMGDLTLEDIKEASKIISKQHDQEVNLKAFEIIEESGNDSTDSDSNNGGEEGYASYDETEHDDD